MKPTNSPNPLSLDERPCVRIALNETSKRVGLHTISSDVVWHPSDALQGHIVISSAVDLVFDELQISFEGISGTWTTSIAENLKTFKVLKAEQKFLTQIQELNISAVEHVRGSTGANRAGYIIPFHFVISKRIIKTNPDILEQCLLIPPSLTAGSTINNPTSNQPYTQICISYQLRMMAKFCIQGRTELNNITASERVEVLPLTEVQPPLDTQHFPTEFVESASQVIQMSIFGPTLGTMTVSSHEPPAFLYGVPFSGSRTTLQFRIELDAIESSEIYHRLRHLEFAISGVIRIKTFCSATTFPKLPSQIMLTTLGKIRLLDEVLKLEPQKMGNFHWLYRSWDEARRWRTTVSMPIHVTSRLPPTFCSALVARFYTLIVRLKVLGAVNSKPFELEVPVQVVYQPPQPAQATTRTTSSPAQTHTSRFAYPFAIETDLVWAQRPMVRSSTFVREGCVDWCPGVR